MASPQKENGYTPVANEILEKLYEIDIDGVPLRTVLFIIRKTYGYNKKRDRISLSQFSQALGKDRAQICRVLKKLESMKIIIRIQDDNGTEYEFNKDYDGWQVVTPRSLGGSDSQANKLVTPRPIGVVTPRSHTKDNNTKDRKTVVSSLSEIPGIQTGENYQADGHSPLDEKNRIRKLAKKLGLIETNPKVKFMYKVGNDFKTACREYTGAEYIGNVHLETVARNLKTWYEKGETRETMQEMIDAYFAGKKGKELTATPTAVFSDHTYNSWKQNKL